MKRLYTFILAIVVMSLLIVIGNDVKKTQFSFNEKQCLEIFTNKAEVVKTHVVTPANEIQQHAITGQQVYRSNNRIDSRTRTIKSISPLPFYIFKEKDNSLAVGVSSCATSLHKICYSSNKSFIKLGRLII